MIRNLEYQNQQLKKEVEGLKMAVEYASGEVVCETCSYNEDCTQFEHGLKCSDFFIKKTKRRG